MQKRLEYNKKDSAIMFILALIVPSIFVATIQIFVAFAFPNFAFVEIIKDGVAETTYSTGFYYLLLALSQVAFFVTFLIYNKITKTNIKSACKINFKLNILQILIIIAIGLIAMYGFSGLINYFEYLFESIGYQSTSFNSLELSNFGMLIINILVVALLPSICEESIFRGVCLNGLKKCGTILMIVLSGLMFCIMHLSIEQCLYQFVLGMILSSVVVITGSVMSSVILHFFNNFWIIFTTYLAGGVENTSSTYVPQTVFDHIWPFLIAIASVIAIYFLLCLLKKVTKNSECEIFNFKLRKQTNENIDSNSEDENIKQMKVSAENSNLTNNENNDKGVFIEKNNDLMQQQKDNKWLIVSFVIGIIIWIINVASSFIL